MINKDKNAKGLCDNTAIQQSKLKWGFTQVDIVSDRIFESIARA